jgi:mxaJ protein
MFSSFPKFMAVTLLSCALAVPLLARDLRVCADPDNLPFSNSARQGFENEIAAIVARDLDANLVYEWQRMGRGFVREYLNRGACDLLIGVPSNFKPVLTTLPYYRSTYVFVTRGDRHPQLTSLNDPLLHSMRIGVQVMDEDYTPPASALARRGMQNEIVGFQSTGLQAGSIIRAVVDREVDVAIVWGPLAGFFARKYGDVLQLRAVTPEVDPPGLPFTFEISMGVRKGNTGLRNEVQRVMSHRASQIREILRKFGVPVLDMPQAAAGE